MTLRAHEVRKIFEAHGTDETEAPRGQRAITKEDLVNIPEIIQSPDSITMSEEMILGKPVIEFRKELNGKTTVISYVSRKHNDLTVQTMYSGKNKGSLATAPSGMTPSRITSETLSGTASSNNIIPQDDELFNERYSLDEIDAEIAAEERAAAEAEDDMSLKLPGIETTETEQIRERMQEELDINAREQMPESPIPEGVSVDDYFAQKSAEAAERRDARLRNIPKEEFKGSPALEKLDIKIDGSVVNYDRTEQMLSRAKAVKNINRMIVKAERRMKPTPGERKYAAGIAAGYYDMSDIPANMDEDKVMDLAELQMNKRALGRDMLQQQRININRNLDMKMQQLFKDSDEYKVSKALVLNYRTPQRNMLKIFGDEQGQKINREVFDPVARNEAERYRFMSKQLDEVRAFEGKDGKKKKLTKKERALTQMVMEGRAVAEMAASMEISGMIEAAAENIKNGEGLSDTGREFNLSHDETKLAEKLARWLETQEMLASDDVDEMRIDNAAKKYAELYNEYYDAINDMLVTHGYEPIGFIRGYAPHIQPEDKQNALTRALKGMGADVSKLPASIAGQTANLKPNKRWNPHFLNRVTDRTDYDIAAGFQRYIEYMSDVVYHIDDIMRVRAVSRHFRTTYAPEEIRENISWARELRYAPAETKAMMLQEAGKLPTLNIGDMQNMDAATMDYIDAMMEEYIGEQIENIQQVTKYSDFVSYVDNYANILAGKQSMADRGWEYSYGRGVLNTGNRLIGKWAVAQVAGNLSSALNQTAQLPMIITEKGAGNVLRAAYDIMSGKVRRAGFSEESDFLVGKKGVKPIVNTTAEMITEKLFTPLELMDRLTATLAVRSAYIEAVNAGKSHAEAVKTADKYGTDVMGSRMKGSKPMAFHSKNPLSQMINTFQIEALNSWEHISQDLPKDFADIEKEHGKGKAAFAWAKVIIGYLLSAFALNRIIEETSGGTPAPFDILGLSANFIASGVGLSTNDWLSMIIDNAWESLFGSRLFETERIGEDREFDTGAALEDTWYNISNDIPFLRNISGIMGWGDQTLPFPNIAGGIEDIAGAVTAEEFSGLELTESLVNFAGQFVPGGRQLGKTYQGIKTMAQGGRMYGYGDKERLQYPVENTAGNWLAAALFGNAGLTETNEFYASGLSGLSANQTRLYKEMVEAGTPQMTLYDTIQEVRQAEDSRGKRDAIEAADLTDEEKATLYSGLISDSRDGEFSAMMADGMSWSDIMSAYNRYAELNADEELNATQKATELMRWAGEQDYSTEQKQLVTDEFVFYSVVPAEAGRYSSFTDAGLSGEAAYELTEIFSELQPAAGKENVTDQQRYEAIVASDLTQSEKMTALRAVMKEDSKAYEKLEAAVDSGLSLEDYVDIRQKDNVLQKYLDFTEAGAGSEASLAMAKSIGELEPEEEGKQVSDLQRYRAVVDSGASERDQLAAMSVLMDESQYYRVEISYDYGITPTQYVTAKERMEAIDSNSSIDQSEARQAIEMMLGLTAAQKAVLWQVTNKSWKPANNPFSTSVGATIYNMLQSWTASDEEIPKLTLPGLESLDVDDDDDYEIPRLVLPGL